MNITLRAKEMDVPLHWAIERRRAFLEQLTETRTKYQRLLPGACYMDRCGYLIELEWMSKSIGIIQDEIKNAERNLENAKVPGRITDADIEQARKADFSHLLPNPVTRSGMTRCFVHDDRHPSMKVYPDSVHCFSCQAHFDAIGVVMEVQGLDFVQAVKYLN